MSRWQALGKSGVEQSRPSAKPGRRSRFTVETLEDRVTPTGFSGTAATAIAVAASAPQAEHGQAVTLTATVTSATPGSPSGKVTFFDGPVILGVEPVVNGSATLNTWDMFLVGSNQVTANYWGDNTYSGSDSGPTDVEVVKAPTVTTLATSVVGQTANFTATVARSDAGGGTPTGVVAFFDGGTLVGSVLVVDGRATLSQSVGGTGTHSYTAAYYGDSGFNPSTTAPATIQSLALGSASQTALSVKAVHNAHGATLGLALSATVTGGKPGAGAPGGTVTFSVDGKAVGTATLSHGKASLFAPLKSAAGHTFVAHYNGHNGVRDSTSPVVTSGVIAALRIW